jgi:hypothetical protein
MMADFNDTTESAWEALAVAESVEAEVRSTRGRRASRLDQLLHR